MDCGEWLNFLFLFATATVVGLRGSPCQFGQACDFFGFPYQPFACLTSRQGSTKTQSENNQMICVCWK